MEAISDLAVSLEGVRERPDRCPLGNQAGAQEEFHAVLAVQLQVLGPDHPETLLTARSIDALGVEAR
jgi:hypothetical protein